MKIAVVLFNLGGPDSLEAVEPFLFNLFFDPAIIRLPKPLRYLVAKLISSKRAPKTQDIYKHIGNKSPLLELTKEQANALEIQLNAHSKNIYKCFVAMRYWHPFSNEAVEQVKAYQPDKIILLPLYPQFSTTTSESSFKDWKKEAKKINLNAPTVTLGCYPFEENFIQSHADLVVESILKLPVETSFRVLFSAHGLPEKVIAAGDPYQWQVEQTVAHVVPEIEKKLATQGRSVPLDFAICYQSKVGPLEWIKPSTESEIARAGADGKAIVITPIAFVSEHSETLVELDIEYQHLAEKAGVSTYLRVPALGSHPRFIESLTNLCYTLSAADDGIILSHQSTRICPKQFRGCVCSNISNAG
jgi:ferrochelatase